VMRGRGVAGEGNKGTRRSKGNGWVKGGTGGQRKDRG
jgi:hypothetical protein